MEALAVAVILSLVATEMVDVDSIETELEAVALGFVLTFMPCPPSRGVMFMGLVTGLRPLRSAVAREVSLARTSDGLGPLGTATRASSCRWGAQKHQWATAAQDVTACAAQMSQS